MQDGYTYTKYTKLLYEALQAKKIPVVAEYPDGHKTIDIAILPARIFIEIDGLHHFTTAKQIESDFHRDHFSDGDDFDTMRIPNTVIKHHLDEVVNAIVEVVNNRLSHKF